MERRSFIGLAVALLCLALEVPAHAERRAACKPACAAAINACATVRASLRHKKAKRQCRRQLMRACRRAGTAACLVALPGTTTTTTSLAPGTGEPGTTSTTMPVPPPPTCGDGRVDAGEVCDGSDLAGATCPAGGVLGCAVDCRSLDTRGCWQCGDGRREGDEECDGRDLGPAACGAPGEMGGAIGCTADCRVDRAGCHRCGNGRVDPGEQCDDGNGDVRDGCTPACHLECGNGTVEPNEECDDGTQIGGDGCSALCALEASYDGGGDDLRECALEWGVVGVAAATVTCTDGDTACDRARLTGECRILAFFCFNRAPISSESPPPCAPSNVAQVALTGGSLDGPGALEMDTVEALLDAFAATLGRAGAGVTRTDASLSVVPPFAAPRACGAVVFSVPAGQDRVVATRTSDAAGSLDDDAITFRCMSGGP